MTNQPGYARVSVNVPLVSGCFDYAVPAKLSGQIQPGSFVEVPFGSMLVQGIVIALLDQPEVDDVKQIDTLLDPFPVLTKEQLLLARWLEDNSIGTFNQCLGMMLLPGMRQFADTRYSLPESIQLVANNPVQQKLLDLIQEKKSLRGRQIDKYFSGNDWRMEARKLVRAGKVQSESYLPRPTLHPQYIKKIQLSCDTETLNFDVSPFTSRSAIRRQARIELMHFLSNHPDPLDLQWVRAHIPVEINGSDMEALVEADMISVWELELIRDPLERIKEDEYIRYDLNADQQAAMEQISQSISQALSGKPIKPLLVYGVTGSGKTELYLRAAEQTLAAGKRVLWLVPEISLTPQTVGRLIHRFPGKVGLVHSRLTSGERYDTWQRTRFGKIPIIVGPRSAIFSPLSQIGLIVVDENHDASYYQAEDAPTYNVVDMAIAYAGICGAACLLGTATPDVAFFHRATTSGWKILRLPERASSFASGTLPAIQVVDMREELRRGNRSIFSAVLADQIKHTFQNNKQSILFLNRRGSSTHVFCRNFGYVGICPHCAIPLVSHRGNTRLLCHTCGHHEKIPGSCPICSSRAIRQIGIGTETVDTSVRELLPGARILRWDADSRKDQKLSEIALTHFKNHQYDILVGTQMVSKGLDFPDVSLVGVVLADIGLNLPDYRAPERIFQVLTQVAGRAGRTGIGGQVVLQTYQPEHYAITASSRHDFDIFYSQELKFRKELCYPPFAQVVRIEYREKDELACKARLEGISSRIQNWRNEYPGNQIEILGPMPCFFALQNDLFRYQLILKGLDIFHILRPHKNELFDFRVELDPPNLL